MYIDHGTSIEFNGLSIPKEPLNADYVRYLEWLAEGNTPGVPPQPTHAQLWERAIAEMRRLRQPILDVLDGLQASAVALSNTERAQVIETAKQGLRDITKLDLSACATFEEMGAVVMTAYASLVSTLPPDLKLAFKEATQ